MKNKRTIYLLIITLLIQAAIPAYLLYDNYSRRAFALENSIDYKFKLSYVMAYGGWFEFPIDDAALPYGTKTVSVSIGDDGFGKVQEYDNEGDCWVKCKTYLKATQVKIDEAIFEEGVSTTDIRKAIKQEDTCYLTAKVYKGVFIPTGIYIGEKRVVSFKTAG